MKNDSCKGVSEEALPFRISTIPTKWMVIVVVIFILVFLGVWLALGKGELDDAQNFEWGFDGLILLTLFISILMLVQKGWGRWEINDDAVSFNPWRSDERKIMWRDIERVKWSHGFATVKHNTTTIHFSWREFPLDVRDGVREFVSKKLSQRFDLTISTLPKNDSFESVRSWVRVISLTLVLALGIFWLWLKVAEDPQNTKLYAFAMFIPILVPLGFVFILARRRGKRLGAYRWREPLQGH